MVSPLAPPSSAQAEPGILRPQRHWVTACILLTVTATDSAGNTSLPSGGFTYTVDTQAPAAPVITQVADDVGPLTGNLNNGRATNDARPPSGMAGSQFHGENLR